MSQSSNRQRMMGRVSSDMRDETEGKDAENHIYEWAVKVLEDEELSRILADRRESWHEFRDEFGFPNLDYVETEEFRKIVSKETTVEVGSSMKNERMAILKYFVSRAERPELKDKRLWLWLFKYLRTDGNDYITQHLSGDMGSGKTDFAAFEGEIWKRNHPEGEILSNIESLEQATTIQTQDELDEWLEENPNTPYFFIFDEANKHASGTGDSTAVEDQLYPLVTFIRKNDGNLVIIGHNSKDIHKWVRELCDFVEKTGKKTAHFYNSVGDDGEPEGRFKTLRNIPQTSFDYDTNEVSDWSWSDETVRVCLGTTKDGGRCGTPIRIPYGEDPEFFCDSHTNQDEPHPDVPAEELEGTPYEPTESSDDTPSRPEDGAEDGDETNSETNTEQPEEVPASADVDENPTPNKTQQDEQDADNRQGGEVTVENIPSDGWAMIYEKTGLNKKHIDSWSQVEDILNDRELKKLKRMMA
jgi:hypothetical protein